MYVVLTRFRHAVAVLDVHGYQSAASTDVRMIAATNRDLKAFVKRGVFREDLFCCLNVFPICLPPLRERKEDIPSLSQHFLEEFGRTVKKHIKGFSADAMRQLMDYDWPGNVRELKQAKKRLREEAVAHVERMFLLKALERNEWNVAHAAEDTGMDRRNL